jgi:hypothetical protein
LSCGTDVGACVAGTETCNATGHWGDCLGEVGPATETCGDAIDNDCDTVADEDCPCVSGDTRSCGPDDAVGICLPGVQSCVASFWGACVGAILPGVEVCGDMTDNDCNGVVDDGCECIPGATLSCGTDVGACVAGTETCNATGHWGDCLGEVGPATETCGDAVDNDCDTTIDEGCICTPGTTRMCGTDFGICTSGLETCTPLGVWGVCLGATWGDSEACDGLDNNCDGYIDESCSCTNGAVQPCGTDMGACSRGLQTCSLGRWGICVGEVTGTPEICGNGVDDNCDGFIDNGCTTPACTTGQTTACVTGIPGICSAGLATCLPDHTGFGPCVPTGSATFEVCNGLDDDCDGAADEGLINACGTCGPVPPEICGNGIDDNCDGFIDNGCTTPVCTTPGSPEICDNGVDDDCDTAVDEGCSGPGRYQHCWTLPAMASRVAFEGCSGWAILVGPGQGLNGRLVCTRPWSLIAETTNASSFCFAVSLDPGQYIEYNSVSDLLPSYWGCVGPFPPGALNGAHIATLGGAPTAFGLVDNRLAGCNFRYRRP